MTNKERKAMQTFLPYESFEETARVLDRQRLGKQRVEAYQILLTNLKVKAAEPGSKIAWSRHPAVVMWRGYEKTLCEYGIVICEEWIRRGYKDSLKERFVLFRDEFKDQEVIPFWLGDDRLHASHKSKLMQKNAALYSFAIPKDLEYFWPL